MAACSHRPVSCVGWLLVLALISGGGCTNQPITTPPTELIGRPWRNVSQPNPDTHPDPAQTIAAALDATYRNNPNPTPPQAQATGKPLNVLALSGGGKYASFCAGALTGWTASGKRPQFDVVTGISSGALVAPFAFLGPKYDERMSHLFLTIRREDLFNVRPIRGAFHNSALAKSEPLAELIRREMTPEMFADLQQAHAEGRRLYVATGNLITLRPVIWDVTALAASGRPDAPELVHKVILAAASIPGWTPAVEFCTEVNGIRYTELHGDGGNQMQTFVRTPNGLPPDSNVFILTAGKLYRDMHPDRPGLLASITSASSNSLYALFRADVANIYTLCAVTRSHFHMVATPDMVKVKPGSMAFDPEDLRRLYETGYQMGINGVGWRTTPPGSQSGETMIPRTGLNFVVP